MDEAVLERLLADFLPANAADDGNHLLRQAGLGVMATLYREPYAWKLWSNAPERSRVAGMTPSAA
jgi:hypothetical protein